MRLWLLSAALVLFASGCLVQDVDLEGKACSTTHPCEEGYQCVAGKCLSPDHVPAADCGAPDAGAHDGG